MNEGAAMMMKGAAILSGRTAFSRRRLLAGAVGVGLAAALGGTVALAQPATPAASPAASPAAMTKVNLNTGTDARFLAIPGVGNRFVREFKEYRPYTSIVQFRVQLGKYVSQDQVAKWEQFVYVPVDPNKADAETLKQLPGVTVAIATQLIAGRPYASNDAFVAALGKLVPAAEAAAAGAYLVTP